MAGFGGDTHVIGVHAGDDGIFNDTQVAVALTKLVSLGVRIVNMSLGGRTPSEPILVDAIHNAAAQGVLLIASAGNDGSYVGWPAADLQPSGGGRSYGIAVGAIDATGHRATFSDYGKHLSLVAPGTYGGTQRRRARRASAREPVRQRVHDMDGERRALRIRPGHVVLGAGGGGSRGVDLGSAARTSRITRSRTSSSSPRAGPPRTGRRAWAAAPSTPAQRSSWR